MVPQTGKDQIMDFDLVVVGGGPVGSEVARIVARNGFKVAIFEEHNEVGRPVQCGGLVSSKVLRLAKYDDPVNTIRGADIYSPGGKKITFMAPDPRAYVLDRFHFDNHMMDRATDAGAELHISTRVTRAKYINEGQNGIEVRTEDTDGFTNRFICRTLVGADGVQGNVSKWFKLCRPKEMVSGYETFYHGLDIDPDKAIVVSGRKIAPGFFGWVIPQGPTRALVGLGVTDPPKPAIDLLDDMVSSSPIKELLKGGTKGESLAGCIPMGIVGRTYWDRVMVVGDAAAQVKPLSGGGLYTGLLAATQCGRVAVKALRSGDCTRKVLKTYQDIWQHSIGKEIKNGTLLRRLYLNLTDEQIDSLVDIINDKDLLPLIIDYGDIDSPSILAKVMLKRAPSLLRFTGPLIRSLF